MQHSNALCFCILLSLYFRVFVFLYSFYFCVFVFLIRISCIPWCQCGWITCLAPLQQTSHPCSLWFLYLFCLCFCWFFCVFVFSMNHLSSTIATNFQSSFTLFDSSSSLVSSAMYLGVGLIVHQVAPPTWTTCVLCHFVCYLRKLANISFKLLIYSNLFPFYQKLALEVLDKMGTD